MPRIIDYEHVLARMTGERGQGMVCNYFNSGAFGFPRGAAVEILGWIGPADGTIREEMLARVREVRAPIEATLAAAAAGMWQAELRGPVWVMPASHWAYELDFGSREWMPGVLRNIGVDFTALSPRTNAAAIEFGEEEQGGFGELLKSLLTNLATSDFTVAFPGRAILCTVHHHKQLWWQTTDSALMRRIEAVTPLANLPSAD
jgi:hypothetical protein